MNKLVKLIVLSALFVCNTAQAGLFDLQEFQLENGMQVFVVENHRAPIVKQLLLYKTGAMDEPLNKGGVAHLLEHLMFRGTKKVPDSSYNDIMAQNGAEDNAFTTRDLTGYHQLVDVSRLELAMALEADRMENLNFSKKAFEKERQIVFEEREQRVSNNPKARFSEDFNKIFWNNHPYGKPVTGTEAEIKNLTADDVYAFYQAFYTPKNAVLVLAGDIDLPTAKTLVQKYYGAVANRSNYQTVENVPAVTDGSSNFKLTQTKKEISTPQLVKQYLVPSLHEDPKTAYALMILASYLGEGDNSFLNRALVLTGKMAGVGASYDALARAGNVFTINALLYDNADAEKAEALIDKTLVEAFQKFDAKALENEKTKMLAGLVYVRDNPEETALLVGSMAALGMSADEIENYEQNIRAVELTDVKSAMEKLKTSEKVGLGILLAGDKNAEK